MQPSTRMTGRTILIAAVLLSLPAYSAADPWDPMPKEEPVVSPRLLELAAERDGADLKAWVFFTDKGISHRQHYSRATMNAAAGLVARASVRRQKMGRPTIVGHYDLPVHRPYVEQVVLSGAKKRAVSRYLNAVSVEAPVDVLRQVAELPFVRAMQPVRAGSRRPVTPDRPAPERRPGKAEMYDLNYGPSLHQLEMMQIPALHDDGLNGTEIRICILDTGFKRSHEALDAVNVIAEWDFINDDGNTAPEAGDPSGQHSHGTKILSLIGGYHPGELIGPAYGAQFLLGKTEDTSQEEPIEEDWWVEGIEWADSMGADIVTSSLGYKDWYTYSDMDGNTATTTIAADIAAYNGILVTTSAGNEGDSEWNYMLAPADADSIIAVGAVWDDTTLAYFSSRGPTYDGRIKPDLVAMGVYNYSVDPDDDHGYDDCHGTSCANPLLAGAAALVLQSNPFLTPHALIEKLRETATMSSAPDTAFGWGLVRAGDAVDLVTAVQAEAELASFGADFPKPPKTLTISAAPNPFNAAVDLSVDIQVSAYVLIRIFDARGSLIDTVFNGKIERGEHKFRWDGKNIKEVDVPSGIYFAHATGVGNKATEKLHLIR